MSSYNYTCPFCDRDTTINSDMVQEHSEPFWIDNHGGPKRFTYYFVVCPNKECRKFTLTALLDTIKQAAVPGGFRVVDTDQVWNLIPPSKARPFPDYVPRPILDDYNEACLIANLSPKASVTSSAAAVKVSCGISGK